MTPRRSIHAPLVAMLWLFAAAVSAAPAAADTAPGDAGAQLQRFLDDEWERVLRESPETATYLGDKRYNDRWSDVSLEAIAASHAADRAALQRLRQIPRADLSAADQLNYDLFRHQLEDSIEEYSFRQFLIPINQRGGIQTADEILDLMRFESTHDYADWLKRLESLPALIAQVEALMRQGIEEKRLNPRIVMQRIPAQIEKQLVDDPTKSPWYKPFQAVPAGVPEADKIRHEAEARRLIAEAVVPAFRRFHTFFQKEYLPACPEAVGAWAQPDGKHLYAFLARSFTTTTLTPDQIHDIGQREVKRIRAEMEAIKNQVGFKGTLAQFMAHLRTDPQFYFKTGDELFAAYLALSKRIDPEMTRLFRLMPRLPYGVRAIPDNIAPDTTTAYYMPGAADGTRAGYYYVNLYQPEARPKYEMEALTLHEAVPGHHFQIALAQELGELPNFRKHGFGFTAYVEGWGLYAESLGEELGLYQDPYSKFGALTYEMWRAVRLVVDTGMHHKRWSRQQAIDFFKANAAKSELDIVNEVDRYIAWPGQALAYKIGQLKIRELRTRAEKVLGERFDVRGFHDIVLGSGAIPLDLLERNVDVWIKAQQG